MYDLLYGVKVLELSQYWPDAVGGYFADLGAEVIKIDHPQGGSGSLTRLLGRALGPNDWTHWNRNKKSLALNLKTTEGHEIFLELAAQSEYLIDGLRAGALESLGLGYEAINAINPAIIYISISGWGRTGAYRRLPTHGMGFDAFSGFRQPVYREDGLPQMPRDLPEMAAAFGALYAAVGGLAAYRQRDITGKGAHIDVSEGEAGASYFFGAIDRLLYRGSADRGPEVATQTRNQYYPTKDGKVVTLMAIEEKFWFNFCTAVGRPDLIGPLREGGGLKSGGSEEERQQLAAIFRTKTRAEWVQFFMEHDIAGAPQHTLAELVTDPHFLARDPFVEYVDPRAGTLRVLGNPIKVEGQTFEVQTAPQLGEHTDAILADLGYPERERAALRTRGVIA